MKKKTSIVVLILLAVLTVFLGYTAFNGWGPTKTGSISNIKTGLDLSGGVSITYQTVEDNPSAEDMSDTIYKLQQRVDQYSTEASVYQQGTNRINIEIPGVSDANAILEELGKPGSLQFMDSEGNVVLEGSDVADAQGVSYQNSTTGVREYIVQLTFTEEGKAKFAEATTNNVGKQIYIIYDGAAVSAPRVKEAITGGTAQIDGMADLDEAKNLASYIRIGSLSLELEEVYSNIVGASLGQEALSTSLLAGLVGTLIVILFMIFAYRISGLASGWALLIFIFLDLIALNAFDITLTLPGIAGVILTIGMAVDANVIIYARMREEHAAGRSLSGSIKEGFNKAFSAILDGNVTTLIAAVVLYILGTGTVKGFAITLGIGIVLSMFSALAISRLISNAFYGIGIRSEKAYGTIKHRKPFDFIKRKVVFFAIAIILVVSAPIGMAYFNSTTGSTMNFSLDFVGGTATTIDFGEELSLEDLDNEVKPVVAEVTGDQNIQFQTVDQSDKVIIKTRDLDLEERTTLADKLAEKYTAIDKTTIESENISSTVSNEMRGAAFRAAVIAVICMLVYIWIRFRDIRFASSSVIALLHDLFVVVAFYTFFRLSVGSSFIAVMLTILGYSINATIVIFDRIRENLKVMKGQSIRNIVNTSITQTLTRSIYSTLTTFITIFVLFVMGVPSIREFSLPIIIGLIAGTYSSVFITGNLWYIFKTKIGKNRIKDIPEDEEAQMMAAAQEALADESAEAAKKASDNSKSFVKKPKVDKTQYSSQPRGKKNKR
ncbi:MAG: protein translocase subunit SecD [Candidatus Alectryocaccobium sp.]|nr:protein translocase subunit SecD [Candidatus Alectryocaccobium sp.]